MRWLFLFVLFLNLAYVGWHLTVVEQYPPEKLAPVKKVKSIVLLSELEQAKADTETPSRTADKQTGAGHVTTEGTKAASDDTNNTRSIEAKMPAKPAPVIKNLAASGAATAEGAPDQPARQPVHEARVSQPPRDVSAGRDERCFSMGPFTSIDKLGGLVRDIKNHVVQADFRSEETADDPLYWVYIKPAQSSAQAKQTASRLRARKITDFYIIRDGDKQYGISLGRFRNKAGAYGLAKKTSKAGFNVLVEPLERTQTRYWLDYELASGAKIPASLFDRYIKGDDKNKISHKSRACP